MSITLKKATEDELYIIQALLESQPEYLQKEAATIQSNNGAYFFSETSTFFILLDETFIGFSSCTIDTEKERTIVNLFCLYKDYEGYGFAATALSLLEEEFSMQKAKVIAVPVSKDNERGSNFLQQNGYRVENNVNDEDQFIFTKTIK